MVPASRVWTVLGVLEQVRELGEYRSHVLDLKWSENCQSVWKHCHAWKKEWLQKTECRSVLGWAGVVSQSGWDKAEEDDIFLGSAQTSMNLKPCNSHTHYPRTDHRRATGQSFSHTFFILPNLLRPGSEVLLQAFMRWRFDQQAPVFKSGVFGWQLDNEVSNFINRLNHGM